MSSQRQMAKAGVTVRAAVLVVLGATGVMFLAPFLFWLCYRVAPGPIGVSPTIVNDWLLHPVAVLLVGAILGATAGPSGAVLAVLASVPAAAVRCYVYGWDLSSLVLGLVWCCLAWLAARLGARVAAKRRSAIGTR